MYSPFNGNERSLLKTINRMGSIQWANNSIAIASDYWINTRNTKTYVFNPSDASVAPRIVSDRNYQDVYSNPGSFVTQRNEFGRSVIALSGEDRKSTRLNSSHVR